MLIDVYPGQLQVQKGVKAVSLVVKDQHNRPVAIAKEMSDGSIVFWLADDPEFASVAAEFAEKPPRVFVR